ncbi:COG4648 family protein [Stutzerimonas frequens]|uniref:COG4648 family protein n=1 Tax=Stutzerimonas frequens TaxID=2968969 RepID=UPI0018CC9E61|nr:hypothetical protein [Stutzerimonas frequens]
MLTRASTIAPGLARMAGLALLLAGLAYPFAVYFGIEHLSPRVFAALLGALWLARLLSSARAVSRATAVIALLFCLALALLDDDVLLRWYPVLINAAMLALFAGSLFVGMPVIERLARLQEPDLAEAGVRYTRQVTKVWVGFFVINGTIAAALTLWAPLAWWTLYNGLIAYLLMGLLFAGEWLVRQRVRGRT